MIVNADMVTRISIVKARELAFEGEDICVVIPVYYRKHPLAEKILAEEDAATLRTLSEKNIITGRRKSYYYIPAPSREYKGILVLGLGDYEDCDAEAMRRTMGVAVDVFRRNHIRHVYLDMRFYDSLPLEAFVESINLGQYHFDTYKEPDEENAPVAVSEITVIVDNASDTEAIGKACQRAALVSLAANGARHFANTASNDMKPETFAQAAHQIANMENSYCTCTVLEESHMAELGMNALLGVARGGEFSPKLVFLKYRHPEASRTVALVGKGVTFDSGGISLKPAGKMHEMKFDMCGAAAVLCTLMAVSHLKPAINVIGVIPAVTNMPDGRAQTPGDIVRAYNGKTIEVLNTDAEGRLILADALAYTVDTYKPNIIVDIATLTGAAVVALGHVAAAVLGTSEYVIDELLAAGKATGEILWPLPLWKDYERMMEGDCADLSNIGPEREAGTITGAAFLKAFVGDTPWAHLDIAGTAYGVKNKPYLKSKYATGFGVRLFTHWLLGLAENG